MPERTIRGPYVQRDRRYIQEWVLRFFPSYIHFFNMRLGQAPPQIATQHPTLNIDRWARVWKKTADYVGVGPEEIILAEGELRRPVEAIGELQVYRDLLSTTFDLRPYLNRPVKTYLVCPVDDPTLDLRLHELGIIKAVFRPPWVEDYLREVFR